MNWKLFLWLVLATVLFVDMCLAGKSKKEKKKKAKKDKSKNNRKEGPDTLMEDWQKPAKNTLVGGQDVILGDASDDYNGGGSMPGSDNGPVFPGSGKLPYPGMGKPGMGKPRPGGPDKPENPLLGKPPHMPQDVFDAIQNNVSYPDYRPPPPKGPKPGSSPTDRFNAVLQVMKDTKELLGDTLTREMYCGEGSPPGLAIIEDFKNSLKLKDPDSSEFELDAAEGVAALDDVRHDVIENPMNEEMIGGWWPGDVGEAAAGIGPPGTLERKRRDVLKRAKRAKYQPPGKENRGPSLLNQIGDEVEPQHSGLDPLPSQDIMPGMPIKQDVMPGMPMLGKSDRPSEDVYPGMPMKVKPGATDRAMYTAIGRYMDQLLVLYCQPINFN